MAPMLQYALHMIVSCHRLNRSIFFTSFFIMHTVTPRIVSAGIVRLFIHPCTCLRHWCLKIVPSAHCCQFHLTVGRLNDTRILAFEIEKVNYRKIYVRHIGYI